MARLEELVRRIEANETGIDRLAGELKEAQRLVAFCREKLYATDEEIKKILESGEKEACDSSGFVQRRACFLLNDKYFAENAFKIIKFCNFVFQNEI